VFVASTIRMIGLIALKMEAASISETPVSFYEANGVISQKTAVFNSRRHENLKSHTDNILFVRLSVLCSLKTFVMPYCSQLWAYDPTNT
jgi:hypothetical protein